MPDPAIDFYDWRGGREAMLRFGAGIAAGAGPTVIAALPLFEEANRTRAIVVGVLRRLAARGIASALPDLPGTGESLVDTDQVRLADWRAAFAAAAAVLPGPLVTMAWRGGALADRDARVAARWHLSPVTGSETARELRRLAAASATAGLYAGNLLSDALIADLTSDDPAPPAAPTRIVRLESDPRPADARLAAPPPWRAAEPGDDPALANAVASDVAAWVARCAG